MAAILEVAWYTPGTSSGKCIGIVLVEDGNGEKSAYIGNGNGSLALEDAQNIADWGSHFPMEAAKGLFDTLKDVS